jgi:caffeoyl-CoA O-methyltransferase
MNFISPEIENYCRAHSTPDSALSRELLDYTRSHVHGSHMLVGELEGGLIKMLIRLSGVKRILELGTYTGYSALIMAEALPPEGELITVDINPQTSEIAHSFWQRSEHGKKITQLKMTALKALEELDNREFDLVFIDADKNNYSTYLKWASEHLSEGGVIISDNTLWSGKVLSPGVDKQTDSIREHNELALTLTGFTTLLLPLRDGIFLLQKTKNQD